VKLRRLADWNENRRAAAGRYRDLLVEAGAADLPPVEPEWATGVYHLYVIRVQDRAGLMKHLGQVDIGTGIHYPVPLHLQNAYQSLGYKPGDFPVAESVAPEIVSLPMFPNLRPDQQERIVREVMSFVSAGQSDEQALAAAR
jgi:dTDP-4-amino-4,6-dideoxygalactose transaminase